MKILWSPLSISRINEIADYISQESTSLAEDWIERLFSLTQDLSKFPNMGRVVPELDRQHYRELIFEGYRIIYRVEDKRVLILTIRHARQSLENDKVFPGDDSA